MNDRLGANDTHKKWGIAIFCLYLFQLSTGAFIHFTKYRLFPVRHRSLQNYFHPVFGLFLIGIAFYQVSKIATTTPVVESNLTCDFFFPFRFVLDSASNGRSTLAEARSGTARTSHGSSGSS